VVEKIKSLISGAAELNVPLIVDVGVGVIGTRRIKKTDG
jgi:thiazole synthase ThiGH ThiG subunit